MATVNLGVRFLVELAVVAVNQVLLVLLGGGARDALEASGRASH